MSKTQLKCNITLNGQLEIDRERGVIYFHSEEGYSALRICGVRKHTMRLEGRPQVDITVRDVPSSIEHTEIVAISVNNL